MRIPYELGRVSQACLHPGPSEMQEVVQGQLDLAKDADESCQIFS